jgi:AcrR family transcriptional regulator
MRRAYRPDEKESRRRQIVAAALQLFKETPFSEVRMADLALRLGLGKGTLYLYFPTKESLFLAVLQQELGDWFEAASARLMGTPLGTPPHRVAESLVQEILDRPLLPKLQSLLHIVLEQNLSQEEMVAFAHFLQDGVLAVGALLEAVLPALPPGQGAAYLIRFHALVMGNQLMSSRPPKVREALEKPELTIFNFAFETVMRGTAVDLLAGMIQDGILTRETPLPDRHRRESGSLS